jgi:acid phosphatase (class A)
MKLFNIFVLGLALTFSIHSKAQDPEQLVFKSTKLLKPFPVVGSLEEQKDIETLLDYQNTRTEEQCAKASIEDKVSLEIFFGGKDGVLTNAEIKKAKKHLTLKMAITALNIEVAKRHFNRARPYITHPEIKPCIPLEKSKSYPSGHTTLSRMYAIVLGEIFPDRKEQLLERANEIAMHRVLGGVHHPSDIEAGKILGSYLGKKFIRSSEFQSFQNEI